MKQTARTMLADMFLEFVNDYLTIEKWAEHNGLTPEHARRLLMLAEEVHKSPHPDA